MGREKQNKPEKPSMFYEIILNVSSGKRFVFSNYHFGYFQFFAPNFVRDKIIFLLFRFNSNSRLECLS
jgi:hypothetical protein